MSHKENEDAIENLNNLPEICNKITESIKKLAAGNFSIFCYEKISEIFVFFERWNG